MDVGMGNEKWQSWTRRLNFWKHKTEVWWHKWAWTQRVPLNHHDQPENLQNMISKKVLLVMTRFCRSDCLGICSSVLSKIVHTRNHCRKVCSCAVCVCVVFLLCNAFISVYFRKINLFHWVWDLFSCWDSLLVHHRPYHHKMHDDGFCWAWLTAFSKSQIKIAISWFFRFQWISKCLLPLPSEKMCTICQKHCLYQFIFFFGAI